MDIVEKYRVYDEDVVRTEGRDDFGVISGRAWDSDVESDDEDSDNEYDKVSRSSIAACRSNW